jgi:alanine dehydrogenase
MIIGIPKKIKKEKLRVAITPSGVTAFVAQGHKVMIEKGAGVGAVSWTENTSHQGPRSSRIVALSGKWLI